MAEPLILVINAGSSSLKCGLFAELDGAEELLFAASADGIGGAGGRFELVDATGSTVHSEQLAFASQIEALHEALCALAEACPGTPCAVGHRVVHGGPRLVTHQRITPEVQHELEECVHFAPLHIPAALELIAEAERAFPAVPQFACFDTAFHQTMPEAAARFPLPRDLFDEGIRRYGFHGLSYESVVHQLGDQAPGRVVAAHLGSGASLAALRDGRSVDTSMGFTPTGGIPMATRSGDLDPGVLLFLMRVKQLDANALEAMLNHDSGLTALSGGEKDMRKLEAAAASKDEAAAHNARLAIEIFCRSIAKTIAAYATVLGGLDMLVFAGGIGEHSARVRGTVCAALEFLGLRLDAAANRAHAATLSSPDSKIAVRIVPSQEDLQIARHSRALLRG